MPDPVVRAATGLLGLALLLAVLLATLLSTSPRAQTTPEHALAGTEWLVLRAQGRDVLGAARLGFGPDGRISGFNGCNSFRVMAMIDGSRLAISGPMLTTRMACLDPALSAQERAIETALTRTRSFAHDLESGVLQLRDGSGVITLELAPAGR